MTRPTLVASLLALLVVGISRPVGAGNVLLIIADDMGVERVGAYAEHPDVGPTPNLDALAAQGVLFRNAWAQPVCSPFRASALTGLQPSRHGVGYGIDPRRSERWTGLDPALTNLPKLLSGAGVRSEALGKWHLAGEPDFTPLHPLLAGFAHHAGFLWGGTDYFSWNKTVDGVTSRVERYATTDITDDAVAALGGSDPFFLWVAFTAPHAPYHVPPADLHGYALDDVPLQGNVPLYHKAMVEALDTELGRLLAAVDLATTTVIFVGDNGTPRGATEPPRIKDHAKGTVYQGGLHVPLIVAGSAVAASSRGRESAALVQATDLFATALELAGVPAPDGVAPESVSIAPYLAAPGLPSLRRFAYAESFYPNGGPVDPATHQRAVRDARYKLLRRGLAPPELYDLAVDPLETTPLDLAALGPDEALALDALAGEFERLAPLRGRRCGLGFEGALAAAVLARALRARRR